LRFRGMSFRGRYVSAKYASRNFDEEGLRRRDDRGMNRGNKLYTGEELNRLLIEDGQDVPEARWGEATRSQLVEDPAPVRFNDKEERVMADGTVIGLPRLQSHGPPVSLREAPSVSSHDRTWSGRGRGSLREDTERYRAGGHEWGASETHGDRVSPSRIVNKEHGLCKRCGRAGHEALGFRANWCQANIFVRCEECGGGHHCRACPKLGFSWALGQLAHPGHVARLEEEMFA
jgi:hypothetical protein